MIDCVFVLQSQGLRAGCLCLISRILGGMAGRSSM